jgi:hypothetical protein
VRSLPPHSPSKMGVNALLLGEGWGGGTHEDSRELAPSRHASALRASAGDLPRKRGGALSAPTAQSGSVVYSKVGAAV